MHRNRPGPLRKADLPLHLAVLCRRVIGLWVPTHTHPLQLLHTRRVALQHHPRSDDAPHCTRFAELGVAIPWFNHGKISPVGCWDQLVTNPSTLVIRMAGMLNLGEFGEMLSDNSPVILLGFRKK
ncbi:hypothetical protein DFH06DRAFT_1305358 [Mycena polygramma]|nr:hypothetical protein DFH06DRAFT_1305358 [Mycena polygramma]